MKFANGPWARIRSGTWIWRSILISGLAVMLATFGRWRSSSQSLPEPGVVATSPIKNYPRQGVAGLEVVTIERMPVSPERENLDSNSEVPIPRARDWHEVRHTFAGDIVLPEEDKQDFFQNMLLVEEGIPSDGGSIQLSIDLSDGKPDFSLSELGVIDEHYEAVFRSAEQLRVDYLLLIEPLAASAVDLLCDSFQEYFDHDMYFRCRTRGPDCIPVRSIPEGFLDPGQGTYWTTFGGAGEGWCIYVSFDSADFPMLESTLVEIERLKDEFILDLLAVLTNK